MNKYPKQLYVTFTEQRDGPVLGFASAYAPDTKAFSKKKITQLRWAYAGEMGFTLKMENGKEVVFSDKWKTQTRSGILLYDFDENKNPIPEQVRVLEHLQPKIIDNIPLEGFKIQKCVGRYSSSNKLWRILDPRGFELETSSFGMGELILNSTIINGVIQGKCIWRSWRTGKILQCV